jgi:hypothetical protein
MTFIFELHDCLAKWITLFLHQLLKNGVDIIELIVKLLFNANFLDNNMIA